MLVADALQLALPATPAHRLPSFLTLLAIPVATPAVPLLTPLPEGSLASVSA